MDRVGFDNTSKQDAVGEEMFQLIGLLTDAMRHLVSYSA